MTEGGWSLEEFLAGAEASMPEGVEDVQFVYVDEPPTPARTTTMHVWHQDAKSWRCVPFAPQRPVVPAMLVSISNAVVGPRGSVTVGMTEIGGSALMASVDVARARREPWPVDGVCELEEAVLLTQPGDHVFGHQLLDLIPRVQTAQAAMGTDIGFVISEDAVGSFGELLQQLGMSAHLVKHPPNSILRVRRLLLATGARQDDRFDGARLQTLRGLGPHGSPGGEGGRIWLSRRGIRPRIGSRELLNRARVEEELRLRGFDILEPDRTTFTETAQRVSRSNLVAGEDGSALHNVIFSEPGARLLVFGHSGFHFNLHLALAQELGVHYQYLGGSPVVVPGEELLYPRDRSWSLHAPSVAEALDRLPETSEVSHAG